MTGQRSEQGSTTSEFLALILVVASAIAVTAGAGTKEGALVESVQHGFCKAIAAATRALGIEGRSNCGDGGARKVPADLPPCTVYDRERLTGANGTFRFIHAEISGKDKITTRIDPETGKKTSYVTLGKQVGAGVEGDVAGAKAKLPNNKFIKGFTDKGGDAGGKIGTEVGGNLVYEFDSHKEAEEFLEQRRGNVLKRAAGAASGPVDGLFDLAREGWDRLHGRKPTAPTPAGVEVDLGSYASGHFGVGKEAGPAKGGVGLPVDAHANGKLRIMRDGSSRMDVRFDGKTGLTGKVGPNDKIARKNPLANELRAEGGVTAGGAAGYTFKFDKNGKPVSLIYRTETQYGGKYEVGNRSKVAGNADKVTSHTYTLDLKDPENAAALRDAVTKYGWSPALFASLPYLDTRLADRLAKHSVEYEQVYDAKGNTIAGGTPEKSKEQGAKARGAGLAVNDDESSRTLRSARYIDHRQPGATWQDLAKCKAPSGGGS